MSTNRPAQIAAWASAAILSSLLFVPFSWIKRWADARSPDGHAEIIEPAMMLRFRTTVVAALIVLFVGMWFREWIARLLGTYVARIAKEVREIAGRLRNAQTIRPGDIVTAIGFAALSLAVRLPSLTDPIRYDEAVSAVRFASRPFAFVLATYHPNNHVLQTLLMAVATRLFGPLPDALRLPSLAAGVMLAPVVYVAGLRLKGRATGAIAAALVSTSSFLMEFSNLARGYAIQTLLVVVAWWAARELGRNEFALGSLTFVVVSALGYFTIPTMLIPWCAIVVGLALDLEAREGLLASIRKIVIAGAITAALSLVLYVPAFIVSSPAALLSHGAVRPRPAAALAHQTVTLIERVWNQWHRDLPAGLAIILGLFALTSAIVAIRRGDRAAWRLAGGAAAVGAIIAIMRVTPPPRVFVVFLPLYLFMVAAGAQEVAGLASLGTSHSRWNFVGLMTAVCFATATFVGPGLLASREGGVFADAQQAALFMKPIVAAGDVVLSQPPQSVPVLYYLKLHGGYWKALEGGRAVAGGKTWRLSSPRRNRPRSIGQSSGRLDVEPVDPAWKPVRCWGRTCLSLVSEASS